MPNRRGRKGSVEDFMPKDRRAWAMEIWADRDVIAKLPSGAWLLREAAKELRLDEEVVDDLLSRQTNG